MISLGLYSYSGIGEAGSWFSSLPIMRIPEDPVALLVAILVVLTFAILARSGTSVFVGKATDWRLDCFRRFVLLGLRPLASRRLLRGSDTASNSLDGQGQYG
jgi:hypothetical protein